MDIRFFRPYIRLLALASLSNALSLWAQKAAVEFPPTTNASQVGTSFVTGYQFSVKMPLSVNALGAVLDHSPSKAVFGVLPASMQVGLWDGSQKLLATATVYDTDPLSGNFNYSTITPVTLSPGQTYVVAGLVPAGKSTLSMTRSRLHVGARNCSQYCRNAERIALRDISRSCASGVSLPRTRARFFSSCRTWPPRLAHSRSAMRSNTR